MSITRVLLGFLLALAIGVVCRFANIPLPAPPALIGALLVVSMTLGFLAADHLMSHKTQGEGQ